MKFSDRTGVNCKMTRKKTRFIVFILSKMQNNNKNELGRIYFGDGLIYEFGTSSNESMICWELTRFACSCDVFGCCCCDDALLKLKRWN